jgi:hypothetical protein
MTELNKMCNRKKYYKNYTQSIKQKDEYTSSYNYYLHPQDYTYFPAYSYVLLGQCKDKGEDVLLILTCVTILSGQV